MLDFGMGIQDAIASPRIHIEGCDPKVPEGKLTRLLLGDSRYSPGVVQALERRGHEVRLLQDGNFALPVGCMRDLKTGRLRAGVTVPTPATAIGY
jgi:gamma-glutamyltranspeptidase